MKKSVVVFILFCLMIFIALFLAFIVKSAYNKKNGTSRIEWSNTIRI